MGGAGEFSMSSDARRSRSGRSLAFAWPPTRAWTWNRDVGPMEAARCSSRLGGGCPGGGFDAHDLPTVALQHLGHRAVERLAVGGGHLQAEGVEAGRHDAAADLHRGSPDE